MNEQTNLDRGMYIWTNERTNIRGDIHTNKQTLRGEVPTNEQKKTFKQNSTDRPTEMGIGYTSFGDILWDKHSIL